MAKRPVYISRPNNKKLLKIKDIEFDWFAGLSLKQKQKSIESLHSNIKILFPELNVLEISSKSPNDIGVKLSAFNLMISTKKDFIFSVETAFQASKVFDLGGPFEDLYFKSSKEAKKDPRLKNSGNLIAFNYFNRSFPLEPKTLFYNWLYINALNLNTPLNSEILKYNAFTDIEFNPNKSINCQAEAAALYISLEKSGLLSQALSSVLNFKEIVYGQDMPSQNNSSEQLNLL